MAAKYAEIDRVDSFDAGVRLGQNIWIFHNIAMEHQAFKISEKGQTPF